MRPEALSVHTQDSQKMQKVVVGAVPVAPPAPTLTLPEFIKLIEELKSLKNRSQSLDLAKLEDQHTQARDAALKAVEKKAGRGNSEEILRLQAEAKKIVEAEHERSKEILVSKFQKIEVGLAALSKFFQDLGPVKELVARLHDSDAKYKKMEDELRVQRKVLAHEQEELERDKARFEQMQTALTQKQRELDAKLKNVDVAKRAAELEAIQKDLDGKLKAYDHEVAQLERERAELNKDFDKLGQKRAELDDQMEALETERNNVGKQKAAMAEVVAKEMALTFEAFVRDMLRQEPTPKAEEPAPRAKAPAPEPEAPPEEASPKKSDFWQ